MLIIFGTILSTLIVGLCSYIYYEMFIKINTHEPFQLIKNENFDNKQIVHIYQKPENHNVYIDVFHDLLNKDISVSDSHNVPNGTTHITYKYKGSIYKLCISKENDEEYTSVLKEYKLKDKLKNENEKTIDVETRIISAYLYNDKTDEHKDVSEILKMYHGPNNNFHKHVQYSSQNIKDIFHNEDLSKWTHLIIDDINADEFIIDLN